jgi:beta-lactam-binding protein with PASTA domain
VLRTDPRAGAAVWPGSSIDLVVAKQVKVPNVVGMDQARAERMLSAEGLSGGSVKEEESNRPPGTVLRTIPEAGSVVGPGSTVDLVVAKAPTKDPSSGGEVRKNPSAVVDRRDR